jgi:hypothetical protein
MQIGLCNVDPNTAGLQGSAVLLNGWRWRSTFGGAEWRW